MVVSAGPVNDVADQVVESLQWTEGDLVPEVIDHLLLAIQKGGCEALQRLQRALFWAVWPSASGAARSVWPHVLPQLPQLVPHHVNGADVLVQLKQFFKLPALFLGQILRLAEEVVALAFPTSLFSSLAARHSWRRTSSMIFRLRPFFHIPLGHPPWGQTTDIGSAAP